MEQHQEQPTSPVYGPLTTPKAFRRLTGAHAIVASLLFADLVGTLINLLFGALIGPPVWWLLRGFLHLFHASLVLDIGSILILLTCAVGIFQRSVLKRNADTAWGCCGILVLLNLAAPLLLFLVKPQWLTIPAPGVPDTHMEAISLKLMFIPQGAAIALILTLLAHLIAFQRANREPEEQLTFSRAHADDTPSLIIEQAYALYQRNLARFNPPLIARLKTPHTFYYYERQPTSDAPTLFNPERELYWSHGHLILNQVYLGALPEQTDVLLPLLARLLYNCNSPDQIVEQIFRWAHFAEASWLCSWMLSLTLYIQQKCEARWKVMERERVLDRDRFAHYCGEAKRLRKLLRRILEERRENNLPDNAIPSLTERINHLDGLIGREARQVKRLRDALPSSLPAPPPATGA